MALEIGTKEDSAAKLAATAGVDPKYLLSAEELNVIVAYINGLVTSAELGIALTDLNGNINDVYQYAQSHAEDANNPHQTDLNQILQQGFEAINKALRLKYNFGNQDYLELKPDALTMSSNLNVLLQLYNNAILVKNHASGSTKIGFQSTTSVVEVMFRNLAGTVALLSDLQSKQDVITPTGNKRVYYDDLTGFGIGSTGSIFNGSGTLENEGNIFVFRSGTGATWTRISAEANRDGIIRGGTGSTFAGLCHIQFRSIWLGTGDFCAESFFRVQTLSDATNRFNVLLAVGLGTANTIRFLYSDGVNGGKLLCECISSSFASAVDSGITVAINTSYDLKIERISGVVKFYVNGSDVATISTNVPSNLEVNCTMLMEKTAGTTNRTCDFDYLKFTKL